MYKITTNDNYVISNYSGNKLSKATNVTQVRQEPPLAQICPLCSVELPLLPPPNPPIPLTYLCRILALEKLGLVVNTTPGLPAIPTSITITAPNGLTIDIARLQNAIASGNSQLPTGSLDGYLSMVFDTIRNSIYNNSKTAFILILSIIILQSFILFLFIIILMMVYGHIGVGMGLISLLIGLIIAVTALIVMFVETEHYATLAEEQVNDAVSNVFSNIQCAFNSETCCYAGSSKVPPCYCPSSDMKTCTCTNT